MEQRAERFEHARRYARDLSPRQEEVLRLIAGGRTNAEIAEALGMTLAGAKWHVSELLSKLGLDCREEAAAFYHWAAAPHRRALRFLGGLWLASPLKAVAATGSGAALVAAGVVLWAAFAGASPAQGSTDLPFFMEARTSQADVASVWGPGGRETKYILTEGVVRRWHAGATHDRTERSFFAPGGSEHGATVRVLDGEDIWTESAGSGFYQRAPIASAGGRAHPASDVGPSSARDLDELLALLRRDVRVARRVGTGTVLGREVAIVEFGPTSHTRDQSAPNGWAEGFTRAFVDPERMFVMRLEHTRGDGSTSATEVTELRWGEEQPPERFVFVPSTPGAAENPCQEQPPSGFFGVDPGAVPEGLVPGGYASGWEVSGDGDLRCTSTRLRLAPPGPAGGARFIHVEQDRRHPHIVLPIERDLPFAMHGTTAYARDEGGGILSLGFVAEGVGVGIRSSGVTLAELTAFAESLTAP